MSSKKADNLKRVLIAFHWQNIVNDMSRIGVREMNRRLEPISYLKSKLATDVKVDLSLIRKPNVRKVAKKVL